MRYIPFPLITSNPLQDGHMDITQFFLLVIERNMISNRNGIEIFYTAFKEACGADNDHLDNTKFYYVIVLLSKALFGHEENPFETMFSQMLVDSVMTSDMRSKYQNHIFKIEYLNFINISGWRKSTENGLRYTYHFI